MDDRDDDSIELPGEASRNGTRHARGSQDRREDGGLFGGYQGPERRSGEDRRAGA